MMMFVFVLIYLTLVLLRPQDYPQMADSGIPILPLAMVSAIGAWVFSREKRFNAPQYLLLPLFHLVLCLSLLAIGWFEGALGAFLYFLPCLVSFFLLANAVNTPSYTRVVMTVIVLCAFVMVAHGWQQATTGVGWTGQTTVEDGRIQYVGIFSDPNDLGMVFVISLPMAVYLGSRGGFLGMRRLFWFCGCLLLAYGIYLTNSRGSFLAVVAMTAVYIWIQRGAIWAAMLGAGTLAVLRMMPSRLDELNVQESSASGRIDAWYEGMQMFITHPVLGVGAGQFTQYHYLTAHNSIILVLAETGIVGFTLWFAFVGYGFWMMYRIVRFAPEFEDEDDVLDWQDARTMALVLLVAQAGFFAAAFFLSRSYVILLYLLAALVVAHHSNVLARFPVLGELRFGNHVVRWAVLSAGAVVGFYVVLKVLLVMG
ncbi:O-antigen ligase family protein [Pseudoxanthomonas sp.]|uniref:O-antigen ligase family protein n=1 Tax=Pseudoxanthomonas sp. TaxID=1871049 RepID=UPI0028C499EF|nr:O-antigen ligase family protein [Pseudoxanthomonas sp.]